MASSPTFLRSSMTFVSPPWFTLRFLLLLSLSFRPAISSEVDDPCSHTNPCTPTDLESYFCDYSIGAESGGYCVACEKQDVSLFCEEAESLSPAGGKDCSEKCFYKTCPDGCDEGYLCSYYTFEDGPCQPCESLIAHPDECSSVFRHPDGVEECVAKCPPRPCSARRHCLTNNAATKFFCNFVEEDSSVPWLDDEDGKPPPPAAGTCERCAGLESTAQCDGRSDSESAAAECVEVCEAVIVASCLVNDDCARKERHFCGDNGTCQACPGENLGDEDWHVDQCFDVEMMGLSEAAAANCANACHTECSALRDGDVVVEGLAPYIGNETNIPMVGTVFGMASGPLVYCQFGGDGECPLDAPEGFVCLISRGVRKFSDKVINCEEAGGVAAIIYNNKEDNSLFNGTVGDIVEIPVTGMKMNDGLYLLDNALGLETSVDLRFLGDDCDRGCSDRVACPVEGSSSSWYCDYGVALGDAGYCKECVADDDEQRDTCFLSGLSLKGAQDCADTCESTLTAASCKICGQGVSGYNLNSSAPGEGKCDFCPDGLKKSHYHRVIPFVGNSATCFKLNQFFLNYEMAESDPNCQLALGFNYICDCEGPGYAGADTDVKKDALVWVPRASGMLSFFSSAAIIIAVTRDREKRRTPYGQLMVTMSAFDLMGSAAYSLTTLPIPKEYYVEGSMGNKATCKAQAFFIQMGTISALINSSLAVYYYFVIKLGWSDGKMKKTMRWLFLCPIAVGMAFAFAGIPFYDMLFLWCNNSAAWWPDIPVCVAIIITTCTMISICMNVYKTEKATRQFTSHGTGGSSNNSMTAKVFSQSMWYLLSFYLTWVPYLALQYAWAAGVGYSSYGFVLTACTLVPLQGFWNSVIFFRTRAKRAVGTTVGNMSRAWTSSNKLSGSKVSRAFSRGESRVDNPGTNVGGSSVLEPNIERTTSVRFSEGTNSYLDHTVSADGDNHPQEWKRNGSKLANPNSGGNMDTIDEEEYRRQSASNTELALEPTSREFSLKSLDIENEEIRKNATSTLFDSVEEETFHDCLSHQSHESPPPKMELGGFVTSLLSFPKMLFEWDERNTV